MTRTGTCSISFPCSSIGEKDGRAQPLPTLHGQFCTETPVQPVQVVRKEPHFDHSFLLSPASPCCLPSTSKAATPPASILPLPDEPAPLPEISPAPAAAPARLPLAPDTDNAAPLSSFTIQLNKQQTPDHDFPLWLDVVPALQPLALTALPAPTLPSTPRCPHLSR